MILQSNHIQIKEFTSIREGETKLGQSITYLENNLSDLAELDSLLTSISSNYIIIGIPEDIGIRANYGKPSASKGYNCFLKYFVNIQSNSIIDCKQAYILGEVFVLDLMNQAESITDVTELRRLTSEIDSRVSPIIQAVVAHNKIPIIIGGGHNNAYGNIKGSSLALAKSIDVLNIDPHADYRVEEGRHSGNGFRYAKSENYLNKYAVYGFNDFYNNQSIIDSFSTDKNLSYQSIHTLHQYPKELNDLISNLEAQIGLEIDLDSIKNMPSSAISPLGFSEEEVIRFISHIISKKGLIYIHLAEGAPTSQNEEYKLGKFLAGVVGSIISNF